jgi:transcriptional regulator with XRE-family HTH domain
MDDVRIGNTLRVVRIRKRLRQEDVARRARVRRETVSRLERGGLARVRLGTFHAVATALGIRVDMRLSWQGGDLDRVRNAGHAALHESVASHFDQLRGWVWLPEVSFSIYGERGVIDILAWHAETRTLLIVELKTELVDPQELVATMNRRARLGTEIAAQRGWIPSRVATWVVINDGSTNRRRLLDHSALLRTAFPMDGRAIRPWLRSPNGRMSALSFWSDVRSGPVRRTVGQTRRVRLAQRPVPKRGSDLRRSRSMGRPPA